jgi:DnaK suppressor protein
VHIKNIIFVSLSKYKVMAQPKIRFSDVELEEFKTLINQKLVDANIDYSLLIGSLSHNDDHGTDDTGRAFNMMEDGSETLSREEVAQLAARQEKFIQSLQAALNRINNKTYGICRVKGTLIPKERLRLVPHATMSIDAKNEQKG